MIKRLLLFLIIVSLSSAKIQKFSFGDLKGYYMHNNRLPQIDIRYVIDLGAIDDPEGLTGLNYLMINSLRHGTKKFSKDELNYYLDEKGINLGINLGYDYAVISIKCLKKSFVSAINLLDELINYPQFPEKYFKQLKKEIIAGIKLNSTNPDWVAQNMFHKQLFYNTPYKNSIQGNEESLKQIQSNDINVYFKKVFKQCSHYLVIVGDISMPEIKKQLPLLFDVKVKRHARFINPKVYEMEAKQNFKQMNIEQSHVYWGFPAIYRQHPNYYDFYLLASWLGGGTLNSKLMDVVREKKGLAYGIYGHLEAYRYAGRFWIAIQTKDSDAAELLVKKIFSELGDFSKEDKEQIKATKQYLIDSFALRIETNSQLADQLAYMAYYDLPFNYFQIFTKKIQNSSLSDLKKIAKKYLKVEPTRFKLSK